MARPSLFTDELFDTILGRIAEGESLRAVCRDDGMPAKATVLRWLAGNPDLQKTYAVAVDARTDALFDEILEIADDAREDWVAKVSPDGRQGFVFDANSVRRASLRIDARKWTLARMAPKKYGDKLQVGGEEADPITVIVRRFGDDGP